MHGIEGQIAQPGFVLMLLDEGDRFAPKGIGGVINALDHIRSAQNRIVLVPRRIQIIVLPAQKAKVLVKASLERVKLRQVSQVRLAEPGRRVT